MVRRLLTMAALAMIAVGSHAAAPASSIQFIFTSDAHYGIRRDHFRGATAVDAHLVNTALVAGINALPSAMFPHDKGNRADERVGSVDFVVEGGDVANREERTGTGRIQAAAVSWSQFQADYIDGVTVTDRNGRRSPLWIVPGNHEASNAVGFYRPMTPRTDSTAIAGEFNRMMSPSVPRNAHTYRYATDKVLTSRDIEGIHFVFLTVWPDSQARAWMEQDLRGLAAATPVVIFVHDQPDVESKHFINPNGAHDINATDRFENLLADRFADGDTVTARPLIEQRALESFLHNHPNITAYFHGNSNWNEFYDWTGPDHTASVHVFRVDSPMKGAVSSKDESRLSFHVATIDAATRTMTVRECLWNTGVPVRWGGSRTVALQPSATR